MFLLFLYSLNVLNKTHFVINPCSCPEPHIYTYGSLLYAGHWKSYVILILCTSHYFLPWHDCNTWHNIIFVNKIISRWVTITYLKLLFLGRIQCEFSIPEGLLKPYPDKLINAIPHSRGIVTVLKENSWYITKMSLSNSSSKLGDASIVIPFLNYQTQKSFNPVVYSDAS